MNKRENKGITLIALVITIIVLLIMAGVSILMITGENSIVSKGTEATDLTKKMNAKEKVNIQVMASLSENGKIDNNLLAKNLKEIEGIEISPGIIKDEDYPLQIIVDNTEIQIENNGNVKIIDKNEVQNNTKVMIYDYGAINEGYELGTENTWTDIKQVNFNEDNIQIAATESYGVVYTKNYIDFSQYSKLCFLVDNTNDIGRLCIVKYPESVNSSYLIISAATNGIEEKDNGLFLVTIDLSNINEEGKIMADGWIGAGNRKIYQIYIEK